MDQTVTAAPFRWNEYHTPTALGDALAILARHGNRARIIARIIAGGTDLIRDMEAGHTPAPDVLVDVTRIAGMGEIGATDEGIAIGAGVTHAQIEKSERLRQHAADGTIGLLALDAEVEVCTLADGQKDGQSEGEGSAFDRIMRPHGVALPILGLAAWRAAWLRLGEDRRQTSAARIAIGPAGPIPFRATEAEAVLSGGGNFDEKLLMAALDAAHGQAQLRTSKHRASKEYRHQMISVLLRRVLTTAYAWAGGRPGAGQ